VTCDVVRWSHVQLLLDHPEERRGQGHAGQGVGGGWEARLIPGASVRSWHCGVGGRVGGDHALGIFPEFQSIDQQRALRQVGCRDVGGGISPKALRDPGVGVLRMGPGLGGRKQAHEFRDPDDDYLWIAGLWEDGDGGSCYTMVTTDAPPVMAPIHNRMPAVLRSDEVQGFLAGGGRWDFQPFGGLLAVASCDSPLKRKSPPQDDPQGGLWDWSP
jgi:hypothetical protein